MCKTTILVTIGVALFIGSCNNTEPGNRMSNAESNSPILATQDQNYTPAIVDEFRATDFTFFLGKDFIDYGADRLGSLEFSRQPGYVGGGTLESPGRMVGIAVFESPQAALDAVEARRHRVPAVIVRGHLERHGIKQWWFCEDQALLSIVHKNMVLEVGDRQRHYSKIEKELWDTAMTFLRTAG